MQENSTVRVPKDEKYHVRLNCSFLRSLVNPANTLMS